jgi:hypothetical protein
VGQRRQRHRAPLHAQLVDVDQGRVEDIAHHDFHIVAGDFDELKEFALLGIGPRQLLQQECGGIALDRRERHAQLVRQRRQDLRAGALGAAGFAHGIGSLHPALAVDGQRQQVGQRLDKRQAGRGERCGGVQRL